MKGGERPPLAYGKAETACAKLLINVALTEDFGIGIWGPHQATSSLLNDQALRIDHRRGVDETSCLIIGDAPRSFRSVATLSARQPGVLSGRPVVRQVGNRIGGDWTVHVDFEVDDGTSLEPGQVFGRLEGDTRALLALERTMLNFLQRLSGVATLTAKYVAAVAGTKAQILDTRKTTPGWRALEKYAVRCGGGVNHRMGLFDAVLIKDNHLAALVDTDDPIGEAIRRARAGAPLGMTVEIEVDSLAQLDRALAGEPDIILVDNFTLEDMAEAVRRRDAAAPGVLLEASGGVNLQTVRAIAETGVDRISVGALTHSAPALDIGLDFEKP
jgi:nicotinate-nucleotide pyrophosphorylase (carboxylating)